MKQFWLDFLRNSLEQVGDIGTLVNAPIRLKLRTYFLDFYVVLQIESHNLSKT